MAVLVLRFVPLLSGVTRRRTERVDGHRGFKAPGAAVEP